MNYDGCLLDSRMIWSVLLSVDSGMALLPQSAFAESEAHGTLADQCCGMGKSSSMMTIVGCKLFCSSLFFQWCTCYLQKHMIVGVDLGCYVEFRRLDVDHFGLLFSVSLYHLHGWPCYLCPFASTPKSSCFAMHSSPIQMMWPAQQRWASSSSTMMEVDLAQSRTSWLVILSCHWIPRKEWSAHIWNFSSCLMW